MDALSFISLKFNIAGLWTELKKSLLVLMMSPKLELGHFMHASLG